MFVKSCPIAQESVDESVVRTHACFIALLAVLFLVTSNALAVFALLYDFAVRVAGYKKLSPLYLLSSFVAKRLSLEKRPTNAGPKNFAAKIGLIFAVASSLFVIVGFTQTASVLILILLICALLEAIFSYCVGCQFYIIIQSIRSKSGKN